MTRSLALQAGNLADRLRTALSSRFVLRPSLLASLPGRLAAPLPAAGDGGQTADAASQRHPQAAPTQQADPPTLGRSGIADAPANGTFYDGACHDGACHDGACHDDAFHDSTHHAVGGTPVAKAQPSNGDAADAGEGRRRGASIAFAQIRKDYAAPTGRVSALRGIDLTIPAGRIFGIIGRSGAGKSSLLRLINRLEMPSAGRIAIDGLPIGALDESGLVALRRRIGMVFQHFNLLASHTVRANVALPLRVAGVPAPEIARRVDEALALVGLLDKRDVYPSRLSGGQKQRVGIARALVSRPDVLLCDEATSALDPESTQAILQLLRDINRRLGLTIVLITHEMTVIREICDDVLVLDRGEMVETGPVWRVFGHPRHEATRALLRPLEHALPEEFATRLRPTPPSPASLEVLELRYDGTREPDLAALHEALGGPVQLLQGGVDRIQGHTQGRLLIAVRTPTVTQSTPPTATPPGGLDAHSAHSARSATERLTHAALATEIRSLGYVAARA